MCSRGGTNTDRQASQRSFFALFSVQQVSLVSGPVERLGSYLCMVSAGRACGLSPYRCCMLDIASKRKGKKREKKEQLYICADIHLHRRMRVCLYTLFGFGNSRYLNWFRLLETLFFASATARHGLRRRRRKRVERPEGEISLLSKQASRVHRLSWERRRRRKDPESFTSFPVTAGYRHTLQSFKGRLLAAAVKKRD